MEQMLAIETEAKSSEVVKKEFYTRAELADFRREIADMVAEIKFHRAEARKLAGPERHLKHLFIRKLGTQLRWRYLAYAILRGRDIRELEQVWRDDYRKVSGILHVMLIFLPKEQHRFWTYTSMAQLVQGPYIFDSATSCWRAVGKK